MIQSATEIESLARSVDDCGEVCFVPALAGLGAPHWQPHARGLLCGISRDSHKGHIARAVLEGIALQNVEILEAMRTDAGALTVLKVDGGAANNDLLMTMQSNFLDVPCVRPQTVETTALGAAALAGLAVGVFASKDEVRAVWQADKTFSPSMSAAARDAKLGLWRRAVARAAMP
jgi:glycerol kinase